MVTVFKLIVGGVFGVLFIIGYTPLCDDTHQFIGVEIFEQIFILPSKHISLKIPLTLSKMTYNELKCPK